MATVKKRPTSDEVKGLLLEGHFGLSADEPLPLTDPISTTQMVLKLQDIKPYDKNPRREKNPAYEDIKASILSKKQLNNNFNVTRRPGDDLFMVESGGNTRLAILKELYLETADEVFNTVHCMFMPWKSEASILTAHLIENEMRGDMMLIDKAYAVQELKSEVERGQGEEVSDRAFTKIATKMGYRISPPLLRRFNYAIKLDQMIPLVLRTGVGGTKLDYIKKVEKAYFQLCEEHEEQFDAAFMQVMSENDGELFDFDQVRNELDRLLEKIIGLRSNIIYMKVNQILDNNMGHRSELYDSDIDILSEPMSEGDTLTTHQQSESIVEDEHLSKNESGDLKKGADNISQPQSSSHQEADTNESGNSHDESIEAISTRKKAAESQTTDKEQNPAIVLKRLRERGYELALKISKTCDLEQSVMPADNGLGYFIETPHYQLTLEENLYKFGCWWFLYSLSEQLASQEHSECWTYLDLYDRLRKKRNNEEAERESIDIHLGEQPNTLQMFMILQDHQNINEKMFTNLFLLIENNRKLRTQYTDKQLWKA